MASGDGGRGSLNYSWLLPVSNDDGYAVGGGGAARNLGRQATRWTKITVLNLKIIQRSQEIWGGTGKIYQTVYTRECLVKQNNNRSFSVTETNLIIITKN